MQFLTFPTQYYFFLLKNKASSFARYIQCKMKGLITTIQRMSIHDGPGIRSTIFVKGCNLRCKWCHNPETFSPKSELEWIADKCINCGACVEVCMPKALDFNNGIVQFDKSKCTACFHCVEHCFPEALLKIGRKVSPTEVFTEIAQDFPYFKESNGGIQYQLWLIVHQI